MATSFTVTLASPPRSLTGLDTQLLAAGIPIKPAPDTFSLDGSTLTVFCTRELTEQEIATGTGVVQNFVVPPDTRPRLLADIYDALKALTVAQKTNVDANLFESVGGATPLWKTNRGVNAGAMLALWASSQLSTPSNADKTLLKLAICAMYVSDNPSYLVHPTFDSSINVSGVENVP